MRVLSTFFISIAICIVGYSVEAIEAEPDPSDVFGKWKTPDDAIINIQSCGESVCGILEWFTSLEDAQGPILDTNNSDENLHSRPLKGIELIYGFKSHKKGWRNGKIYDPESGKTYKSKLTRLDDTSLKVQGCVGPVCKKFVWTKISAE